MGRGQAIGSDVPSGLQQLIAGGTEGIIDRPRFGALAQCYIRIENEVSHLERPSLLLPTRLAWRRLLGLLGLLLLQQLLLLQLFRRRPT